MNILNTFEDIAEDLLKDFSLQEVLEENDLSEIYVLALLLQYGLINEPERIIEERSTAFTS